MNINTFNVGIIDFDNAIQVLVPNALYSLNDGEVNWRDERQVPTEEEIQSKLTAQVYAKNRVNEYPSIDDVTVALAEKMEGSSTMWDTITAQRLAVKAKYPK